MVIFGHNALDSIHIGKQIFWSIIQECNFIDLSNGVKLLAAYPILPWVGVMSFGYYIGSYYERNFSAEKRKKIFFIIGLSSMFMFFIVRLLNGYGNLNNWKSYELGFQTVSSFVDPAKYPPSISYLLMTLGPVFFILSLAENLKKKILI